MGFSANSFKKERGSILAQVIFALGAVGLISTALIRSTSNMTKSSKRVEQLSSGAYGAVQITSFLRSRKSCEATFVSAGRLLPDGGSLSSRPTAVIDENNVTRFETCSLSGGSCNRSISSSSKVADSTMYFKGMDIVNYNKSESRGELRLTFERVNQTTTQSDIVIREPIHVVTDSSDNITSCVFSENGPFDELCNALGGTLDFLDTLLCRSLWIGPTPVANDDYALTVEGNLQVTRNLVIENTLMVGDSPPATIAGALSLDGNGVVQANMNVGLLSDKTLNSPGSLQTSGGMWVADSSETRPTAFGAGDLYTQNDRYVHATGAVRINNLPITQDLSSASLTDTNSQYNVVTTGWVRRKISDILTSDTTDLNSIFNDLYTHAYNDPDPSEARAILLRDFCQGINVNSLDVSEGTTEVITGSIASNICTLNINHLDRKCNTSGNCNRVYATSICLGSGSDRACYSSWPNLNVFTSDCVSPTTHYHSHGSYSYSDQICPIDKVYVGGSCCTLRLKNL